MYCNCPIEVCEQRDVKGLYKKARAGIVKNYTGISAPYEPPEDPDIELDTAAETLDESISKVISFLRQRGIILH